ncbi:MAG: alkaline phosphatase family protein [Labilithrix sp.]|nr:alkaline phosphatase family protein [Labilithrix sp.]MCW5817995.1 alkaline phosphatase family protein [Labilithrix sp.]
MRWQEVHEGTDPHRWRSAPIDARTLTPNLHALGERAGAFIGAPGYGTIAATGPNYISQPGYEEILTGRFSGCDSNHCPRTVLPTLLDEARAAGAKVAVFASWERIDLASTASPGAFFVSAGRHGDDTIAPWPGVGDYRPDRITSEVALAYYAKERPDVFYLSLGDPDEHAHHGDYSGYVNALRRADETLGRLLELVDENTHVVVTADHGRADSFADHGSMPEAARVWMAASGPRFLARGAVTSPHPRRLADIAPTLRVVLGLPSDVSTRSGAPIEELFGEGWLASHTP